MNKLLNILVFLLVFGIVYSGPGELMNNICYSMRAMMPVVSLTLLVVAGLVYAIGKVLGQEFRSKTESWATTIVIGAVLGLVLAVSAPFIIQTLTESLGMDEMEYACEEYLE
jgi:drug/metabolite transporter (DMT)-like permease